MSLIVSCSFCHEMNDISRSDYCDNCGHRADVARIDCNCPSCGPQPNASGLTKRDFVEGLAEGAEQDPLRLLSR